MKHGQAYWVAAGTFLIAAASLVVAAERLDWSGKDPDNKNVRWTCSNVGGNKWTLKKNGTAVGEYEGVTSTADFVELQSRDTKEFDRVRLYKDHLSMNKEGSKTEWIEIARGSWTD